MSHDLTALFEALERASTSNDAADRKAVEDEHSAAVAAGAGEDDFRALLENGEFSEPKRAKKLLRRVEPGLT